MKIPSATAPLLRFDGLKKSFGGRTVLDGISGEISPGEVILLQGDNGSGKTTLLNILTGCLEPDSGSINLHINGTEEQFAFPRPWSRDLNPWDHFTPERVASCGVARVWQDIRLSPSLDLADNIAAADHETDDSVWAALFRHRRTNRLDQTIRHRAADQLAALGLSGRDTSSGDRISLGQSKRVAISRALAAKGRILLLDEPLSGLDASGIKDVLAQIRSLVRDHQLAVLVIEHALNAGHLAPLVDRTWNLRDGNIIESAPDTSGHPAPSPRRFWHDESFTANYHLASQALERGATLTRLTPRQSTHDPARTVLQVENLVASRGRRIVLGHDEAGDCHGLSFELSEGEIAILEAPNGWGKSTLFDILTGTGAAVDSGQVIFRDQILCAKDATSTLFYRLGGRALPSDTRLFPSLRLSELARIAGSTDKHLHQNQRIDELSGGELRRAAISATGEGFAVIYDELFHSLDSSQVEYHLTTRSFITKTTITIFLEPNSSN